MGLVAVIGGSGVSDCPIFDSDWKTIETGYSNGHGSGRVWYKKNNDVIFIPRHGYKDDSIDETFGPCRTQYAANLIAIRMIAAREKKPVVVLATSAVGILNDRSTHTHATSFHGPTEPAQTVVGKRYSLELPSLVVPDDVIDESLRNDNLYGVGVVMHVNPRPPFSTPLREIILTEARTLNTTGRVDERATYVCIPGDRFGTTAEGKKRGMYADIVGMTVCPEVFMALQLGLHYAVMCFPVDKDTDARHDKTLDWMKRYSEPEQVPQLLMNVIPKAQEFADTAPQLEQLKENVIFGDLNRIQNEALRESARELKKLLAP